MCKESTVSVPCNREKAVTLKGKREELCVLVVSQLNVKCFIFFPSKAKKGILSLLQYDMNNIRKYNKCCFSFIKKKNLMPLFLRHKKNKITLRYTVILKQTTLA